MIMDGQEKNYNLTTEKLERKPVLREFHIPHIKGLH